MTAGLSPGELIAEGNVPAAACFGALKSGPEQAHNMLREIFVSQALRHAVEHPSEPIMELGLTSAMIPSPTREIAACFGTHADPTLFFSFPTFAALTAHLGASAPILIEVVERNLPTEGRKIAVSSVGFSLPRNEHSSTGAGWFVLQE